MTVTGSSILKIYKNSFVFHHHSPKLNDDVWVISDNLAPYASEIIEWIPNAAVYTRSELAELSKKKITKRVLEYIHNLKKSFPLTRIDHVETYERLAKTKRR